MKPLIDDINKIVYRIFKRQHPILAEMIVNWGKIVGIKYCDKSSPLKIITNVIKEKKINILCVGVDNSSLSLEMAYQQEIIIERIAIYLGYKGIHKIRLMVRG